MIQRGDKKIQDIIAKSNYIHKAQRDGHEVFEDSDCIHISLYSPSSNSSSSRYFYINGRKIVINSAYYKEKFHEPWLFGMNPENSDAWFGSGINEIYFIDGIKNLNSMKNMFANCRITDFSPISGWDTSKVRDLSYMFSGGRLTSLEFLQNWDISNVEVLSHMFEKCYYIKKVDGIQNWDLSSCNDMSFMFNNTYIDDISSLEKIDLKNVENLSFFFANCISLKDISALAKVDFSKVKNLSGFFMFDSGNPLIRDYSVLSEAEFSSLENMSGMFKYNYTIGPSHDFLKGWNVSKVKDMSEMFYNSDISDLSYFDSWDFSSVESISGMFCRCQIENLKEFFDHPMPKLKDISMAFNSNKLTSIEQLADLDVEKFDNIAGIFGNNSGIKDLSPVAGWNLSGKKSLYGMFSNIEAPLNPVANWDTADVEIFDNVLSGTKQDPLQVSSWNTDNSKSWYYAFSYSARTSFVFPESWSFDKVETMTGFLYNNVYLKSLQFTGQSFRSCQDFTYMFAFCNQLTTVKGEVYDISANLDLMNSPLTADSAMVFINGLKDGVSSKKLYLKSSTYKALSEEQIAVATAKGWSVVST